MRQRLSARRGRRRGLMIALVFCLLAVSVATVRLFVLPERGMPSRVDAIVMLNGTGDRLDTALGLAWAHRAPYVVISRGSPDFGHGSNCAPQIPHETIICFDPDPSTTRGEAEFAGRLARQYGWHSIVLVTTTPQASRGRLRMERCFTGPVYVMTAPVRLSAWPYEIVYEWGALIKALIFQRAC
jgi:uncharacterized SAM-binding protein YcdF (DUF218 family)